MQGRDASPTGDPPKPALPHPATRQLTGLLRGELERAEARHVVRHLLTGCPRCVYVTSRLWGLGKENPRRKS